MKIGPTMFSIECTILIMLVAKNSSILSELFIRKVEHDAIYSLAGYSQHTVKHFAAQSF